MTMMMGVIDVAVDIADARQWAMGNGQDPRSRSTDFCGAAAMPFFEESSEIS